MASEAVYVDLDLKGNALVDVKAAVEDTDVPNWGQVKDTVTTGGWNDAAATIAAGLGLTSTGSTIDVSVGGTSGLEAGPTGLWVNTGAALDTDVDGLFVKTGNGIAVSAADALEVVAGTGITVDATGVHIDATTLADFHNPAVAGPGILPIDPTQTVAVDTAWLTSQIGTSIAGKADSAIVLTAGAGLTGGGDLTLARTFDVVAADATIVVTADAVGVGVIPTSKVTGLDTAQAAQDTAITNESAARVAADGLIQAELDATQLGAGLSTAGAYVAHTTANYIAAATSLDNADVVLDGAIKTLESSLAGGSGWNDAAATAAAGAGIAATGTVLSADVDGTTVVLTPGAGDITGKIGVGAIATSQVTGLDAKQLAQDDALAAETLRATTAEGVIAADVATVTGDLADEVARATAAEGALDTAIKGINITGTGTVTVTESAPDSNIWTVNVPAVQLANTYSGTTGVDSTSINADLVTQGVTDVQPGDLYVNTTPGGSFIASAGGDPAADVPVWTTLTTPTGYITSVDGTAGEIAVANPGGPNVTVGLDPLFTARVGTLETGKADKTTAITAGAGLVGGGTLALAADFAVGAGTGISVAADSVAIDRAVVDTWYLSGTTAYTAADIANVPAGTISATDVQGAINELDGDVTALAGRVTTAEGAIGDLGAADTTLQANIDAEATARADADALLQAAVDTKATAGSAALVIAAGGSTNVAGIPTASTITVVDAAGCVATVAICKGATGYDFTANVAFTGTVYWSGL